MREIVPRPSLPAACPACGGPPGGAKAQWFPLTRPPWAYWVANCPTCDFDYWWPAYREVTRPPRPPRSKTGAVLCAVVIALTVVAFWLWLGGVLR